MAQFLEYAGNIEAKSLTSQEATIKHLEGVFKILDKTRTDDRILKLVAEDMGNVFPEAKGILRIQQRGVGNATYVHPDGGFQIFQNGKLIINKIMIEKIKNAIFNIPDFEYINFSQNSKGIRFIYYDVIILGNKDSISVFYDSEEMGVFNKLQFINKKISLETFNEISDALNYMNYLSKVVNDIRYETYHYFFYKMKKAKISSINISFGFGGYSPNSSKENLVIRCDVSD
ncbi:hypothetical protein J3D55_002344 [Chryseobacterium ginsenosidimutans]|uniref:hypothetical protein n=1 Tax=Chryseobacterium ginsenosidimutans TaxID=687846 RepID=UPI002167D3A2|nr:hypothetical protein [Chryseobacterium ginsenosidimutans]MCS3869428.1 hypothetical protein [Chryseobacterium ginsenosidimutans]